MLDKKVLYKLTHGMYVLTTDGSGCFVDAVSQVGAGDVPMIAVAVMKKNFTNEKMHQNDKFAISIFGKDDDPALIKTFGFQSSRDVNKFEQAHTVDVDGVKVVDTTLGYLVCEKVDCIENDTHTIFLGKVIDAKMNKENDQAMTYAYYQEHKEDLMKVTTEKGKTAWICLACGYVEYNYEVLPDDYTCPICGVGKEMFEKK